MRKQRYSVKPWDVGRTWASAKIHVRKGKSAIEGDSKKSWSGIETEAGAE